jgi:hypothetical protein
MLLALVVATASGGCRSRAKTPDEAYRRFSQAVSEGDGGALFDALDQQSRWAWMTVQKCHREAYDIVLSNYPEGPARDRELRRYEKGATATSARELFKSEIAPSVLPMLVPLVVPQPPIEVTGEEAQVVLPSGARVRFRRDGKGGWGFAGLAKQAEERSGRAYHDLELVRASAADYERAAARGAR